LPLLLPLLPLLLLLLLHDLCHHRRTCSVRSPYWK
jgi:hypothetical protein